MRTLSDSQEQQSLRIQTAGLVLARLLLSAPDRGLLGQLQNPEMLDCWPLTDAESLAGIQILRDALHSATVLATPVEDIEHVNADYLRLFGLAGKTLAQPNESVWLSDDHLVFEAQTLEVRHAYSKLGLGLNVTGREPDDHLGFQISFITQAVAKIREAGQLARDLPLAGEGCCQADVPGDVAKVGERANADEVACCQDTVEGPAGSAQSTGDVGCCQSSAPDTIDQRDPQAIAHFLHTFLNEHTLQFSSQFTAQLRTHANTSIYRSAADLVDGLVTSTVAFCSEVQRATP